jgi:hypothetical protein
MPVTALAYPSESTPELPEGHYSRLCRRKKGEWAAHDEAQLEALAREMKDCAQRRKARLKENEGIITMPSGYLYLGQFVDHDITRDNRSLAEAGPDVEETGNYRTPRLDLDHLYGKDPASVPCIYESDGERLKLGLTQGVPGDDGHSVPSSLDDLARTSDGTAILIDPRNDENLIVAQLHVLFAKFHNRALELIRAQPGLAPDPGATLFEQARRFVTWHYQWLVVNDFLPFIIRSAVLSDIKQAGSKPRLFARWYTPDDEPVALPVEFTVAAFRFGHSMVQDEYDLNRHVGGVRSSEIIRMTKRGGGITTRLPANYVIDWRRFFWGIPAQLNRAQEIDTFMTEMLYDLPKKIEGPFRFHPTPETTGCQSGGKMMPTLPEMTLKRGSRVRLPSGQEFARHFRYTPIESAKIPRLPAEESLFPPGLRERTPLWYYLLREATAEPNPEPVIEPLGRQLQKLGTIGSRIVAETIYQLLNADRQSITRAGSGWAPPVFTIKPAGRRWCLRSMPELVNFVEEGT